MYKKVIFGAVVKTEDGKILGKEVGGYNGRIIIENEKGDWLNAIYGTVDEKKKFHSFCTHTRGCGQTCPASDSPSCRYNGKYQKDAGYYVDVD